MSFFNKQPFNQPKSQFGNQGTVQGGFGQKAQIGGFGGGSLFGGAQPQQTGSLFGGASNSAQPVNSAFGGTQPVSPFGGGNSFGNQQQTQPGIAQTGFGVQNSGSGFGAGPGLFGQQQNASGGLQPISGGLFGKSQAGPSIFGQNNQGIQNQTFGQTNTSFNLGAENNAQVKPFGQFDQSQSSFGGGLQNNIVDQNSFGNQGCKFHQIKAEPQLLSINYQYTPQIVPQDEAKGNQSNPQKINLTYRSIRADEKFQLPSIEMLRLCDRIAVSKNQPQENPEFAAQRDWAQRQAAYPLLPKIQGNPNNSMLNKNPSLTSYPGQTQNAFSNPTSGLGAQQQNQFGSFNQNQQQQQPSTLFGGTGNNPSFFQNITKPNTQPSVGAFGLAAQQQPFQSGFNQPGAQNASNTFGALSGGLQQNQPGQGLFGGQTNPSSLGAFNTGLGSLTSSLTNQQSSLFGSTQTQPQTPGFQQNQAIGGLFGQPLSQNTSAQGQFGNNQNQQQPASVGGLFNSQQTQLNQPGTGLFGNLQQVQQTSTGLGSTGGVFGQQQATQNPQGGLFGQNPQSSLNSTSGLFGQTNQATQPTSAPASGLFGAVAQTGQANQPTALFGNKDAGSSSLFGQQTSTGGLFSSLSNQPAKPGNQLFGQNQTLGGSLFGQTQQQTPNLAGGLFGQQSSALKQPTGGLFGQASQPQNSFLNSSNLLGNNQNTTQGTSQGGLFGDNQGGLFSNGVQTSCVYGKPQQLGSLFQQTQNNQNPLGLQQSNFNQNQNFQQNLRGQEVLPNLYQEGYKDPYGLSGSFLEKENPMQPVEEEIEELKREAHRVQLASQNQVRIQTEIVFGGGQSSKFEHMYTSPFFYQQSSQADIEEEQRYLAKQELKQKGYQKDQGSQHNFLKIRQMYSLNDGSKKVIKNDNSPNPSLIKKLNQQTEQRFQNTSKQSQDSEFKNDFSYYKSFDKMLFPAKNNQDFERRTILKALQTPFTSNTQNESISLAQSTLESEILNITGIYNLGVYQQKEYPIRVHISHDVSSIFAILSGKLEKDFKIPPSKVKLLYKSALLSKQKSLEESGITQDCTIQILVDVDAEISLNNLNTLTSSTEKEIETVVKEQGDSKAPEVNYLPLRPAKGHECIPSYDKLVKMSKHQLQSLEELIIKNEFGSIKFQSEGLLDITNVDLSTFVISATKVQGYKGYAEGHFQPDLVKPKRNTKLNVPAIITLNYIPPKNGEDVIQKEKRLREQLSKKNQGDEDRAEFISYDHNKYEWVFKVPHWSEWGADSDSEDLDQQIKIEHAFPAKINALSAQKVIDAVQIPTKTQQYAKIALNKPQVIQKLQSAQSLLKNSSLKYASPSYIEQNQINNEKIVFKQNKAISKVAEHQQQLLPQKYITRKNLEQKIDEKQKLLEEMQTSRAYKENDAQCKQTLKLYGIKSPHISVRGIRPCFRPLSGNIQNNSDCQLLNFYSIKQRNRLESKMMLCLHSIPVLNNSKSDLSPDLSKILINHIQIQDSYFQRKEPSFQNSELQNFLGMIPNIQEKYLPSEIFEFLKDVAFEYIRIINQNTKKNSQLDNELYVVCMLNALFGDPRIHLIHAHPQSKNGMQQLKNSFKIYSAYSFVDIKNEVGTSKQRRNAVAELLRQICSIEHPTQLKDEKQPQYSEVLQMLLNGQVVEVVRYLTELRQHKMALILSQAVSAQNSTKQRIRSQITQISGGGSDPNDFKLLQTITCLITSDKESFGELVKCLLESKGGQRQEKSAENQKLSISWYQVLCSMLLYVCDQQCSLTQILKIFIGNQQCQQLTKNGQDQKQDLLFVLLKIYVSESINFIDGNSTEQINDFRGVEQAHQRIPEFQIQWLVQYVLRQYKKYENELENSGNSIEKIGVIQDISFDKTISQYLNQLLLLKKYQMAILLCLQVQNSLLRTRLFFEVIGIVFRAMQSQSKESSTQMEEFLKNDIKLKYGEIIAFHKAIQSQYQRNYDQAIAIWNDLGNYQEAHNVFIEHIAPLYFSSTANIQNFILSPQKEKKSFELSQQSLFQITGNKFKKSDQRIYIDKILQIFSQKSIYIEDWQNKGEIILKCISYLDNSQQYIQQIEIKKYFESSSLDKIITKALTEATFQNKIDDSCASSQ